MVDNSLAVEPLHVIDQEGQPYESVRRCCNMCGAAFFFGMLYVATYKEWSRLRKRGELTCCGREEKP